MDILEANTKTTNVSQEKAAVGARKVWINLYRNDKGELASVPYPSGQITKESAYQGRTTNTNTYGTYVCTVEAEIPYK